MERLYNTDDDEEKGPEDLRWQARGAIWEKMVPLIDRQNVNILEIYRPDAEEPPQVGPKPCVRDAILAASAILAGFGSTIDKRDALRRG